MKVKESYFFYQNGIENGKGLDFGADPCIQFNWVSHPWGYIRQACKVLYPLLWKSFGLYPSPSVPI